MNGLHIYNQTEMFALPSWYFIAVFGLGLLFAIIGGTMQDKCERKLHRGVGFVIFLISMIAMYVFGLGWQMFQLPTGKYEYTVSIDDSKVKMFEFNDKYEIVRQEGELWVIRDK
jgi:hypothetical protein